MVLYPEVQKKAQGELDAVIGSSRLLTFEDQPQLEYRADNTRDAQWAPVAPINVSHTCSEDDIYRGYCIPKEAIVFGNVWLA
ncbi:O-methylsterigmatocystin oxidoreductase OS=Aspergillus flavus GN=ordA PE=3 SV=2 [Rhizoctonia solani AG-1 IB]|uniref:O-methylsterigmatocystin oxidoreductase n=1 Tax=Thanatephorus cucumeris (strain AG1-IB / isolate 7/3/14) TaxID=1108050 RepID=A0A0B7FE01_THACB|nr:O-methylsterigmatocystin oxidoreductase OS=Aspergillus flavus GN=ordA PE=3 SV=2 [Rhizoctonia solani AG-1 IB]